MYRIIACQGQYITEGYSYDMSCRVAHFVRNYGLDCYVVGGNDRAVSECVPVDREKDRIAQALARKLVNK
jgi:hypothetical protein